MKRKQSGKPKLQKTASIRVLEEQRMLDTLKSKVNDNTLKSKVDDNTLKSKVDDNTLKSKVDDNTLKSKVDDNTLKSKVDDNTLKSKVDDIILKNQNDGNVKVTSLMNLKIKTRIKDGIAPMIPKSQQRLLKRKGELHPLSQNKNEVLYRQVLDQL